MIQTTRIRAIPNAWKAGWFLVDCIRNDEAHLRISKPMAPSRAPDHNARAGATGSASSRNRAKNSSMFANSPTTTVTTASNGASSAPSPTQSKILPENPVTRLEMETLTTKVRPMTARVSRSRSLPRTKLGAALAGTSKTVCRAWRIPESQPSPE